MMALFDLKVESSILIVPFDRSVVVLEKEIAPPDTAWFDSTNSSPMAMLCDERKKNIAKN